MKYKTILLSLLLSSSAMTADYKIDIEGMHASILFKISHIGTSWLRGGFDKFEGSFSYDAEKPNDSKISITVDTSSINSNHAERDKHIRGEDFLNTDKFSQATFISESFKFNTDNSGVVIGKFKLHGVEKTIEMAIKKVGEGKDPWGGYRVGFEGIMEIELSDFGITRYIGKTSNVLELSMAIEGIRK
ncbi:MAG: YceI family protein [Alcanivoracaceae bacterium]|nr:YceI family protein [Alcanivoracaceae bacterium]